MQYRHLMVNNAIIDNRMLHCKFFDQFIFNDWDKLNKNPEGLEIARWRTLYWLAVWEKEIDNCYDCSRRKRDIKLGLSNAGIKLHFEPEVYFK